jgi:hypothetical protein
MKTSVAGTLSCLSAVVCLLPAAASAQSEEPSTTAANSDVLLTPWGDPDLQGVWDYRSITPLERPRDLGDREFFTAEEIAQREAGAARRMDQPPDENTPANLVHAQYMTDPGRYVDESGRTSLIVDPPNGRMPEMTDSARERQAAARANRGARNLDQPWLDRAILERCITQGLPRGILPTLYNNNIQITQAPGTVAITHEMVHDTRIIPLDGRDFTGIQSYMGESRGHFEGNTLVVETRNFNGEANYRGAGENMVLTERYTRVAPDKISFMLTVEDETTWTQPWTVAYTMIPTEGGFYEYACHEGNYGLRNILENLRDELAAGGATGN